MDILHERDLKAQEQAVSVCQKNSEWGRETACLNEEIWLEIRKKKGGSSYTLEEGAGNQKDSKDA